MQASYTIAVEGDAAASPAFAAELAAATAAAVEREDAGLNIPAAAAAVWSFVVEHHEDIKTALEIVSGLIALAERRKVHMSLVDRGREITIEAANRADLEAVVTHILQVDPTASKA